MKTLKLALFLLFLFAMPSAAKTHTEIGNEFGDTIVSVNIAKKDGSTHSGTGFIAHRDGLIATAGHVVDGALFVNLTFKNGAVSDEAVVLAKSSNKDVDLALLKIEAANLPSVIFRNSDYVKAGEEITVIGNPRRLQNTITNGLISQLRQISKDVIWQQMSAPISPSSSGSPIFNRDGFVIGVALSSLAGEDNQNLNFAIPSNYLMQLMLDNGYMPQLQSKKTANQALPKVKGKQPGSPKNYIGMATEHIKKSWSILKTKTVQLFNRNK